MKKAAWKEGHLTKRAYRLYVGAAECGRRGGSFKLNRAPGCRAETLEGKAKT